MPMTLEGLGYAAAVGILGDSAGTPCIVESIVQHGSSMECTRRTHRGTAGRTVVPAFL